MKTWIIAMLLPLAALHAQEYTYDNHGNLATDNNKQIASIHYNHLNLVDTITYTDGRRIIYAYSATGQKLREQAIGANSTLVNDKRYSSRFLYSSDTLREIQHEDGRTVPALPGNTASSWEYQYHLKDHLGNVRSTLTSVPLTSSNTASFESAAEAAGFQRYRDARMINSVLFDHTKSADTHYAQRLNGTLNERYGIARSISVMPGDTVKLEVYAKYVDPNANNLSAALNNLLTQIAAGTATPGTVVDGAGYATTSANTFPFAELSNSGPWTADRGQGTGPKAYLNWLIFNTDFTLRSGGFVRMTEAPKETGNNVAHEKLASELVIDAPGFVYAYVSNEETKPLEVFFDDFSVTQVMGPVIQQTEYDPFGLMFGEYNRESTVPNDFLYNGKELQTTFDLNWYDYGARMYDAVLGRWHVIDPMAEKYAGWSPYNYVMNNPLKHIDRDGREVFLLNTKYDRTIGASTARSQLEIAHDQNGNRKLPNGEDEIVSTGGVLYNGTIDDMIRVRDSKSKIGKAVVEAHKKVIEKSKSESRLVESLTVAEDNEEDRALREAIESPSDARATIIIMSGAPTEDDPRSENLVITSAGTKKLNAEGKLVPELLPPTIVWDHTAPNAQKNLRIMAIEAVKIKKEYMEQEKAQGEKRK